MEEGMYPIDVVRADLETLVKALDEGLITSESLVQEYRGESNQLLSPSLERSPIVHPAVICSLSQLLLLVELSRADVRIDRIERDNINGLGLRAILQLAPEESCKPTTQFMYQVRIQLRRYD